MRRDSFSDEIVLDGDGCRFRYSGASVGCFDLPSSKGLNATVEQIKGLGREAIALTGDVTQAADLQRAVDGVERRLGPLSVAINCAGIANAVPAEEMPLEQWQRMLDINLPASCFPATRLRTIRLRGVNGPATSLSCSTPNSSTRGKRSASVELFCGLESAQSFSPNVVYLATLSLLIRTQSMDCFSGLSAFPVLIY
jgi:NAD(P)-dependent dehydrogenase (short-subunit alcohol dehydrogenase family)